MVLDESYADFVNVLGHANVLRKDEEIQSYSVDVYTGNALKPAFVLKPASVQQISQLLPIASKYGLSITPRGAGLDPAMGSMASGGIIIDLTGLNKILEVNEENRTMSVQCGATFEDINKNLTSKGLSFNLEPVTSPKATIGGFIASHGVGYGLLQHGGSILNVIRDLEVVLSDGSIIRTGFKDLPHDGVGYNLTSLMIGSEGLLGVITEATSLVFPAPEMRTNIVFSFSNIEEGINLLKDVSKSVSTAHSMFIVDAAFKNMLAKNLFSGSHEEFLALVRLEGPKETVKSEIDVVEKFCKTPLGNEVGENVWSHRFLYPSIKRLNKPVSIDEYCIPIKNSAEAYGIVRDLARKQGVNVAVHLLGLGYSMVINLIYTDGSSKIYPLREEIDDAIISLRGKPLIMGLHKAKTMKKASPCSFDLLTKMKKVLNEINLFCPNKLAL
jgi:FAD/FMN-containing dehydrogenase